jgi:hypothetical protein
VEIQAGQAAERSLATNDRRQTAARWRERAQSYEQTLAGWLSEKPGSDPLQALRDCARRLGAGDSTLAGVR